jgi:hypothetical protein
MDIVNVRIIFRDAFTGATNTKTVTRSKETYEKMKSGIGAVVDQFDKRNQIHYQWVVEKVEIA